MITSQEVTVGKLVETVQLLLQNGEQGKNIGSLSFEKPIYAFVFGAKGFMYNLTFKGTKFSKITPE